jgi:carboxyl-terminal processing protease
MRSTVKQMETLLKLQEEMNISFLKQDLDRLSPDKDKQERYNLWLKNLRKDIYLDQAVKVIADIQNQRNLAKVKTF